jgi:transmembrane sensor
MNTDARPSQKSIAGASVREAAAHWHQRLQCEPVPERIRAAFSRWIDKSPEHHAAYVAVDRAWQLARSSEHDTRILALRHEAALRLTRRSVHQRRWQGWAAAAAIALVVVGVLLAVLPTTLLGSLSGASVVQKNHYRTGIGERLSLTLEDGSQVTLNTDSVLRPAFDANERRVVLERGQALFEVAKNPARPFVVETAKRRFVAVGTAFDVRIAGERVQVTMLEGAVRVERKGPEDSDPADQITAGEQLTVMDENQHRIRLPELDRVTSWRRGQVIFEASRLADAVDEINRYSATQIVLASPALGDLLISGAFATGRPNVFVEAITAYFPIKVTRVDENTLLLSARERVAPDQ